MFQQTSARRTLLAAFVAVNSAIPLAAIAGGHAPGHFLAVMAAKDPARHGVHLAAADQPSADTGRAPAPGTYAAIMASKDPSRFGPHLPVAGYSCGSLPSQGANLSAINCTAARMEELAAERRAPASPELRPGSWLAIMSVKDPAHYGPNGRKRS